MNTDTVPSAKRSGAKAMLIIEEKDIDEVESK